MTYASVTPRPLVFPRDHGAHPEYRTEWWYLTGFLDVPGREALGFQLTFFRVRTTVAPSESRFSPQQLIIAHAAIADRTRGVLLHDERAQRVGFGLVDAGTSDTDVRLDRWTFVREGASGEYRGSIPARGFDLALVARPTQPLLLQGRDGYSQKGPLTQQASYYYSQPQLAIRASLRLDGTVREATGIGWLDHEWSSSVLAEDAVGWDWIGMNLADGTALTAFQIRSKTRRGSSTPMRPCARLAARCGRSGARPCDLNPFRPGARRVQMPAIPWHSASSSVIAGSRHVR